MPTPDSGYKRQKHKSSKATMVVTFIIGAMVGIMLFTSYQGLKNDPVKSKNTEQGVARNQENTAPPRIENPQQKENQSTLSQDMHTEDISGESYKGRPARSSLVTEPTGMESIPPVDRCKQLAEELHLFFLKLDHKPYFQTFVVESNAQQHFIEVVNRLLASPPVVSRETDDLYTILTNMAHFFRVLGKENIVLIKTVWDHERDIIEDFGLTLFRWISESKCSSDIFPLTATLENLYDYAGFFLTTMGGRSYLFRRDSRSRLLVSYYAVLVIDLANQAHLNLYGIHIPEILPLLIQEMENSNQLIYKELYLDRLYELAEKYQ